MISIDLVKELAALAGIASPVIALFWQVRRRGDTEGRIDERLKNIEQNQKQILTEHKACRTERMEIEADLYDRVNEIQIDFAHHQGVENGRKK